MTTSITVYFIDNSSTINLEVQLAVKDHAEPQWPLGFGTISSSGVPGNSAMSSSFGIPINNQLYDYSIMAFGSGGQWPGINMHVLSVVIAYTMSEAL